MKTAVFHNFLDNIGGAEYFSLKFSELFNADLYTTCFDPKMVHLMGFDTGITSIGRVPKNPPWRQTLSYKKFRAFKSKKEYDMYFIAGDWAMGAAVHNKPNVWYSHSPAREIWDLYEYTRSNIVPYHGRKVFDWWVRECRKKYLKDIKHVEHIVSNSKNVRNRIHKYFNRDSEVIYPPTDTEQYVYADPGDYWLSVNRLISHKQIEIQFEAFRNMSNERLVIVGCYEQSRHFKSHAQKLFANKPSNVTILSWVTRERLIELYSRCRGLIATACGEDYGMTPVEAMASGKPVIAADEGGYRETVVDGSTGVLVPDLSAEKLRQAVIDLGPHVEKYKKACIDRAQQFSAAAFREKMDSYLRSRT